MSIIYIPLGWLLEYSYKLVNNYGLALILFTVIVKAAMVPLSIKQQQGMASQARLQPRIQALKKRYEKDRQKFTEEQQKLYQEEKINPLSGCLPMLIQMPVLFGLFHVIYRPLTYILGVSKDTIDAAIAFGEASKEKGIQVFAEFAKGREELFMLKNMDAFKNANIFDTATKENIMDLGVKGFKFLGLDLLETPNFKELSWLWIIPLLSGGSALVSSLITMKINKQGGNPQAAAGGPNMNAMLFMMPIMSLFFTFSFPAGIGFYWTCSNLLAIVQQVLINRYYSPALVIARQERKNIKMMREREAKIKDLIV